MSARTSNGSIVLDATPAGGYVFVDGIFRTLVASIWLADSPETVRVSIRNEASGTIAYLQGSAPLRSLAEELGFLLTPGAHS